MTSCCRFGLQAVVDYILKTDARYHTDGRTWKNPHTFMSYCGAAFNAETKVCGLTHRLLQLRGQGQGRGLIERRDAREVVFFKSMQRIVPSILQKSLTSSLGSFHFDHITTPVQHQHDSSEVLGSTLPSRINSGRPRDVTAMWLISHTGGRSGGGRSGGRSGWGGPGGVPLLEERTVCANRLSEP